MWRKWVFIFDLDVLQSSYTHFAWDAHARQEIETLTPQLTSPKKHVFFFLSSCDGSFSGPSSQERNRRSLH